MLLLDARLHITGLVRANLARPVPFNSIFGQYRSISLFLYKQVSGLGHGQYLISLVFTLLKSLVTISSLCILKIKNSLGF